MNVSEIMTTKVFSVKPDSSLHSAELVAEAWHFRHIPVVNEAHEVVGIFSMRDIVDHLATMGASHFVPVSEIMNTDVKTCTKDLSIEELASMMLNQNISAVPVVEGNTLIGIVTERDFLTLHAVSSLSS